MPMMIDEEKSDIIFYTDNSFYLEQHLPNAQLILYRMSHMASCFSNRSCSSNTRALSARLTPTVGRSGVSLDTKSPIHSLTCSGRITAYPEVIPQRGGSVRIGDNPT